MKQEHTGNIQIGHRQALLSSPTYQITAIRMNYVRKMFQMNCTAKQLISLNKNTHFRPCFFPVTRMETSINSTHSASTVQFDHWITRIKSNLRAGSP